MALSVVRSLEGEWIQTSSENFGEFLKALGISSDMADKLNDMPASEKWSVDGETITLTRSNPNKTVTHSFKLGEDVIEPTMTGDYKCCYAVEGNAVVNRGSFNGIQCTGKRQLISGKLHWEFYANEPKITCLKIMRRK